MRSRSRVGHRSTCSLVAGLALALAAACHKSAVVTTRTVTAYAPAACSVGGTGYATYTALGDFDPPPPATGAYLDKVGTSLPELDPASLELVVSASEGVSGWVGLAPVGASGNVDVLLLPGNTSCALSGSVGTRVGSTLSPIGNGRVMLVGGTGANGGIPGTFVADLTTGAVVGLAPGSDLQTPRTGATVTAFGGGALVAGGLSPSSVAQATAEIYSPTTGGFRSEREIQLSEPRAKHGAVVLADGRTLLVGGITAGGSALRSLEIVDPTTREASEAGIATLVDARSDPTVLRLASGEILVAGGVGGGVPVTTLEWFGADASQETQADAPWGGEKATLIALPAGGALVVVTPPASPPPGFQNTWVIAGDRTIGLAPPVLRSLTRPLLFGGAGGAPLLWTGDAWLQWQPFGGSFISFPSIDTTPPDLGDATCSPDPGLAMWLDPATSSLVALRFAVDNAYSPISPESGILDLSATAPDRLPEPGVAWLTSESLTLGENASAFVADRTYTDVEVEVAGVSGSPCASVVLRDESGHEIVVPDDCGVKGLPAPGSTLRLDVKRRGQGITFAVNDNPADCKLSFAEGDRVSVGVRGPATVPMCEAASLSVVRLGSP